MIVRIVLTILVVLIVLIVLIVNSLPTSSPSGGMTLSLGDMEGKHGSQNSELDGLLR